MAQKRHIPSVNFGLVLAGSLLVNRTAAQCFVSGYSPACDSILSSICFNSMRYDTCANTVAAICHTNFGDPCMNICNNYANLQTCVQSGGTGQSAETQVLKAWLATCNVFRKAGNYDDAYACWLFSGGTDCKNTASVAIYPARGCSKAYGLCKNLGQSQCCSFTNGTKVQSAGFVIPADGFGAVYSKGTGGATCGPYTAYRVGGGCVNGVGKKNTGGGWTCCSSGSGSSSSSSSKSLVAGACSRSTNADVAVFGRHHFDMGIGVPREDAARLEAMIARGATYDELPQELMKYELALED